jgi:hypothetical protein
MKKLIIAALLITGCASVPVEAPKEEKPADAVDIVSTDNYWPSADMLIAAHIALKQYGKDLLAYEPKDAKEWGLGGDKLAYYSKLLSAMAKFESGYDANQTYTENFKDQWGNLVRSVGIMQVSSESCAGYLGKYIADKDLKLNANNLACAVAILNKWVPKHGVIAQGNGLGGAIYWSVLREKNTQKGVGSTRKAIKEMLCAKNAKN